MRKFRINSVSDFNIQLPRMNKLIATFDYNDSGQLIEMVVTDISPELDLTEASEVALALDHDDAHLEHDNSVSSSDRQSGTLLKDSAPTSSGEFEGDAPLSSPGDSFEVGDAVQIRNVYGVRYMGRIERGLK